jgi:hypothetical protein
MLVSWIKYKILKNFQVLNLIIIVIFKFNFLHLILLSLRSLVNFEQYEQYKHVNCDFTQKSILASNLGKT